MSLIDWLKVVRHCFDYVKYLGLWQGTNTFRKVRFGSNTADVSLHSYPHPIVLRRNTADLVVFEHILMKEEYRAALPENANFIVDCGANIGLSTVYFASRFPHACVIALEPEHSNFIWLEKNTRHYQNVICIQAALWKRPTKLSIANADAQTHAFQVIEADQGGNSQRAEVVAVDMLSLIDRYEMDRIDLLKMDIEGSEKEVFADASQWIDCVDRLVIELHEHLRRGATLAVYQATQMFQRAYRTHEYDVFIK